MVAGGTLPVVPPFDAAAREAALAYQVRLTKPAGSLGRLEELATWYAGARGRFPVEPPVKRELYIFAGDHGVAAEGVSAFPAEVTPAMVMNFLAGGAAINALARACNVGVTVVDTGVAANLPPPPAGGQARFVAAKIGRGTKNFRVEPAMTRGEAEAALALGVRLAAEAATAGADLLLTGEMGIGNTTAAAAIVVALTGRPPEELAGNGTGLDEAGRLRKAAVIRHALALHHPDPADPVGVLAAVGGFEIAAMAGFMVGAAAARVPVIVDGFICGAAALIAARLRPEARAYFALSHLSAEQGHRAVCSELGLTPLFDLGMRLGEGTGAALASHLVMAAVEAQARMATFDSAGVPDRDG